MNGAGERLRIVSRRDGEYRCEVAPAAEHAGPARIEPVGLEQQRVHSQLLAPAPIRVVSDSEEYSNASPPATRPGATISLTIRRPPGSTSATTSPINRAPAWGISGSGTYST